MKKFLALSLAAVLLLSVMGVALAENKDYSGYKIGRAHV